MRINPTTKQVDAAFYLAGAVALDFLMPARRLVRAVEAARAVGSVERTSLHYCLVCRYEAFERRNQAMFGLCGKISGTPRRPAEHQHAFHRFHQRVFPNHSACRIEVSKAFEAWWRKTNQG